MPESTPGRNKNKAPLPQDFVEFASFLQGRQEVAEGYGKEHGSMQVRTDALLEKLGDKSFEKWREAGVEMNLWPDANGLRIDAGPRSRGRGIHTHIPYDHITPELAHIIREQNLLVSTREIELANTLIHGDPSFPETPPEAAETYSAETVEQQRLKAHAEQIEFEIRVAEAHGRDDLLSELRRLQRLSFASFVKDGLMGPAADAPIIGDSRAPSEIAEYYLYVHNDAAVIAAGSAMGNPYLPRETIRSFLTREARTDDNAHPWERKPLRARLDDLLRVTDAHNIGSEEWKVDELQYTNWRQNSWRRLQKSHAPAAFSNEVFKARKKNLYENPGNAEVSKILTTLLEMHSPEELAEEGVQITRAAFSEDLQFVGFWSEYGYRHVVIDPKRHIRSEAAQEHFSQIEEISSDDFKLLEGLVLPYRHFRHLAHNIQGAIQLIDGDPQILPRFSEKLTNSIEGALNIIGSEIEYTAYKDLVEKAESALTTLRSTPINWPVVEDLHEYLGQILKDYDRVFVGQSASSIIKERLIAPERIKDIRFDQDFWNQMPEDVRERRNDEGEREINKKLATCDATATVVLPQELGKDIPYANAAKTLRALGVKAAPSIRLVTGARFSALGDDDDAAVKKFADDLLDLATRWGANLFTQGTHTSKVADEIVTQRLEREKTFTGAPGELPPPRQLAIEPGGELFFPENPHLAKDPEEMWPMLPVDIVATSYPAGWAPGGSLYKYRPHLIQSAKMIKASAEDHPDVLVLGDGGGWSLPEAEETMKLGTPVVSMCDMGRLATLTCALDSTRAQWEHLDDDIGLLEFAKELVTSDHVPKRFQQKLSSDYEVLIGKGLAGYMRTLKNTDVFQATHTNFHHQASWALATHPNAPQE